jgi:hypothetical protein
MKIRVNIGSNAASSTLNGEAITAPSNDTEKIAVAKVRYKKSRGISKTSVLKLPFERDEVADAVSATGATKPPSEKMKQVVRDIARGVQDTDRGAVVGSTYNRMKR